MNLLSLINEAEQYLATGKNDLAHNCILKLIQENVIGDLFDNLENVVCQAEEDYPLEYRTKHFKNAIDDACKLLNKVEENF